MDPGLDRVYSEMESWIRVYLVKWNEMDPGLDRVYLV